MTAHDISQQTASAPDGLTERPISTTVAQPRRPRWHNYTAFVLSGGAARGALQVGALRALLEHGERPDVIVGTSIGAWNGAFFARNPTLENVAQLERVWHSLTSAQVLLGREPYVSAPAQALASVFMLTAARRVTRGSPSLYSDAGLRQLITRHLGTLTFADVALPLRIVATDLTHGKRTIFSEGPLASAVLASSAIPGIFPPVRIGEAYYVDGATVDNASIEAALALGARRIFILDVGYNAFPASEALWSVTPASPAASGERSRLGAPHPLASVIERTTQVLAAYQLQRAMERVPRGVAIYLIRPSTSSGGSALDFGRATEWMEHAYRFTNDYLDHLVPALRLEQATSVPNEPMDHQAPRSPLQVSATRHTRQA